MKNILLLAVLFSFVIASCNKVENPYSAIITGGGDTTIVKIRKVLLEDYTGHKCGNCPQAALTAQTIKSIYKEQLVILAVHAGFYAKPMAAPYDYDFRTIAGTDWDVFFGNGVVGNPNGMINRRGYPTNTHVSTKIGEWIDTVAALTAIAPDAFIKINNSYNSTTRVLNTSIKTEFLNFLSGTYKLMVVLSEDSIVKPQVDYSKPTGQQNILDYVHQHVLRDAISSTNWGDVIATGSAAAGDTVVKAFQYTLPATYPAANGIAPSPSHCYVVAFVYNAATYEVVQVEEKKIK